MKLAATQTGPTRTEHAVAISAPPEAAYRVISDVSLWPVFFPPTVHCTRISGDDTDERIQVWAFANGEVKTWTSHRRLEPAARRVAFSQEVTQAPVESMSGEWSVEPRPDGGSLVRLTHAFAAEGGDPRGLELISRAVDHNSGAELEALKVAAERLGDHGEPGQLISSFEGSELITGSAAQAYDFIYRCQDWPGRLPHVARVDLREDVPGLQVMEMDTRAPDGTTHTTKSGRVCLPHTRIVYKQVKVPPILAAHVGEWLFEETPEGVRLTGRHRVVIRPEAVPAVLGAGATVASARTRVREALLANSMATIRQAKAHVEAAGG
jgi:aromatase